MGKSSENAKDCSDKQQTNAIGGEEEGCIGAEGENGKRKGGEEECLITRCLAQDER